MVFSYWGDLGILTVKWVEVGKCICFLFSKLFRCQNIIFKQPLEALKLSDVLVWELCLAHGRHPNHCCARLPDGGGWTGCLASTIISCYILRNCCSSSNESFRDSIRGAGSLFLPLGTQPVTTLCPPRSHGHHAWKMNLGSLHHLFFLFTINNMLCITINVFYTNAPEGDRIPLSVAVIHRLAVCWFLNPPLSIAMLLNVSNLKFCRCQLLRKTLLQLLPNGSWRIKHLSNSMPCSCHIITPLINRMT